MQKLLREALIALIEERGFDALTVGEITQRAMVSRAAFYRTYRDKYDLVEQIFGEVLTGLAHDLDPLRREVLARLKPQQNADPWGELVEHAKGEATPEPLVRLFEHVAQYERLYRVLLGERGGSWFRTKMRAELADVIRERLQAPELHPTRRAEGRTWAEGLGPTLLAALTIELVAWWLEHGRSFPPRQAATYYLHLTFSILREVDTWD